MENSIVANGLTKYYDGLLAVDHVSFRVRRGEVFGFLGPNGAGKTTTIRMLVGLTTPSEGTATVAGYDIREEIVEVKRRVGVVPETSNLYDELSVWDNLLFISQLYHVPRGERADRIEELLETFHLLERRDTKFGRLSKGLKRRVVIATALVHQPEIVFMDEPTSGLDVVSALSLRKLIAGLSRRNITVFLTTHYIEEADQLTDRVAIIVNGRIVKVDTPEEIKGAFRGPPVLEARLSMEPNGSMIRELEEAGKVEVKGHTVKIMTEDVTAALGSLARLASRGNMKIERVNTSGPTLEDAFVRLTGVSPDVMRAEKERGGR
ncbi:ABC transporter ATP-binding protein [Candidatus Bathyarchaeota archaeon]|nr:MAG: ABC transporter ATP-binding protein [Candidatus Bathyarchaeota archaeon]